MESNSSYFARRSMQEKAAAENAIDPLAQEAHLQLAARYDQLAEACDEFGSASAEPPGYVRAWLHW